MAAPLSPFRLHGNFVFLSGHVPVVEGTDDVPLTFEEQVRVALDNLRRSLSRAGSAPEKVLSVTAFVTAREDIPAFNSAYLEMFAEPFPARALLVSALPNARYKVEIQAVAHL